MKYRVLGKTGLKVSVIGLGTWQFGGEWGRAFSAAEVAALLAHAKEFGINLLDTAECYGDHLSEALIGFGIENDRNDWIVATKFGHRFDGFMKRTSQWGVADVLKQLEDSLRALRTDRIDLYQFHSGDDAAFENDELWTMLSKQVAAGKIRHLGLSISNDYLHQAEKAPHYGVETIQIIYNRLDRKPEEKIFPFCVKDGLGVLARVPLASGYLSGKYKPGTSFPDNDVRIRHDKDWQFKRLKQVEEIQRAEVPAGVPMAQWALAWCLRHPAVSAVIPGCKNLSQLESNAKAAALVLPTP